MNALSKLFYALLLLAVVGLIIMSCEKQTNPVQQQPGTRVTGVENVLLQGSVEFCQLNNALTKNIRGNPLAKAVAQYNVIYGTDFVSAGVGKMRNIGSGTITLSGVSGTITKAYLYWHGPTNSSTNVGNPITVNGNEVTGTNIGYSNDNCWGYSNSQAYRADVTSLVQLTGNGAYALSGFGGMNPNGASLVIFFNDGNGTNNRDIVIFDGNDSNINFPGIIGNPDAPPDPGGWNISLSGINYSSGTGNIQLHVADGQSWLDAPLILNGNVLAPGPQVFDGTSVPPGNDLYYGLWDIRTFDVTSFLSPGPNTLTMTTGVAGDCLALIVAVVDLPSGALATIVPIDIKPTSCPNPMNSKDNGRLPVAILGTGIFDVSQIDVSTVALAGVTPITSSIEDLATPYGGSLEDCYSCTSLGFDSYPDLVLHFDHQTVFAALGPVNNNDCVTVELTGNLKTEFGGKPIKGKDIVRIIKK